VKWLFSDVNCEAPMRCDNRPAISGSQHTSGSDHSLANTMKMHFVQDLGTTGTRSQISKDIIISSPA
jgi:hypothetical protein